MSCDIHVPLRYFSSWAGLAEVSETLSLMKFGQNMPSFPGKYYSLLQRPLNCIENVICHKGEKNSSMMFR